MSINESLSYFKLNIANMPNLSNNQTIESMIENLATFKKIVKKAYYKVALENHPDIGGNEDQMKVINDLYRSFMNLKVTQRPRLQFARFYTQTYCGYINRTYSSSITTTSTPFT